MTPLAPFIALDGIDGTGKSTQCRLLVEWLTAAGVSALKCADPGGTPVGDKLREILLNSDTPISGRTETLLFMASRAELVHQVIRPALESGTVVVSDRFISANVAYQGHAGELPPEDIWAVGRFSSGDLLPDLTVILDLPVAAAVQRRGRAADRLEARGEAYFERVRSGFLLEATNSPDRFRVVDASADVTTIQAKIRTLITPLLRSRGFIVPVDS